MHSITRIAAACSLIAALAACGGGGGGSAAATANSTTTAAGTDAAVMVARNVPPALPGLQEIGMTTYLAPGLTAGTSVAVSPLATGGFAMAWLVPGADTAARPSVQVQAFNSRGQAQDGVTSFPLDRAIATAGLAVLPDGSVLVAFTQVQDDTVAFTETRSVVLERFDRQGRPQGAAQVVAQQVASLMAPAGPSGEVRVIPADDGSFALAWQDAAVQPGMPPRLWAEVLRFDAAGRAQGAPFVLDPHLTPSPRADLSRIAALPGGGVLVPRLFSAFDPAPVTQEDWLPLGSGTRVAAVPAGAYAIGGGLPAGTQVQPLANGGYVALAADGTLQFFGNDGTATGPAQHVAQPGKLLALAGGGFLIVGWDASAQAYDASGQPVGARVQTGLAQAPQPPLAVALSGGSVARVQPQAGGAAIDLLAPAK